MSLTSAFCVRAFVMCSIKAGLLTYLITYYRTPMLADPLITRKADLRSADPADVQQLAYLNL